MQEEKEKKMTMVVENDMVRMVFCDNLYIYSAEGEFKPVQDIVEDIKYSSRLGYFVIVVCRHGFNFGRYLVSNFNLSDYVDLIIGEPKERV